ncbi:hypothetical protein Z043_116673 [Scleropages formosus]|uniref:Uncharacterized protein n=1 Tax=Scleropages formosus TaxID=113540 RepID=A0A0P7U579_SCLFO|nr:hypothetical protein Z043_116673 [Scleropages formosus]
MWMNASDRFFAKLRSLALTLESETVQLQQTQKNPGEGTGGAGVLDSGGEGDEGIHPRLSEAKGPEKDPRALVVEQDGDGGVQEQEGKEGQDAKEADALEQPASCRTPVAPPPPTPDTMRTPRLSDFGLSGFQPMESVGALSAGFRPTIAIETPPLLDPPKMPKTPKCVLQMDEDAPTPRLEDFGISEYTTCFNNDFTMELLRKQPAKAWRDTAAPADAGPDQKPANCSTAATTAPPGHSQEALELHSVKLPDFCTPVSKVNQKQTPHSPPDDLLGSALQLSPELPVFETPYVSKLMSTVKSTKMASSDSAATDEVKTHPPSGDAEHDKTSLCDLPSMAARPVPREESTPEMPVLETFITSSVAPGNENVSSRVAMFVENEPQLPDLQSHPEEWDLLSPPPQSSQTLHLPAPDTPQMPDVSLFTQDIIKLLSQSNTRTPAMVPPSPKSTVLRSPTAASGKENRSQVLAPVSEDEFAALPGYLRQMPLSSMNQAIGKINRAVMDKHCSARETPSFMMEELKRITSTGVKAHLYILCLTELGRLQQVQEESSGLVFRVLGQVQGRDKNATLRTPC